MNSGSRPAIEWWALVAHWRRFIDRPLVSLGRRYTRYVPLVMILGLLASLLEGVGIGLLIPLVALLAESVPEGIPRPLRSIALATASFDPEVRVFVLAGGVLGLIALKTLMQAANGALIAKVEGLVGRDIRNAMSARILAFEYPFFMKHDPNRLANIISTEGWLAMEATRWTLSLVPATMGLLVFSVLLAWLDWRLFAIVLAGAAAIQSLLHLFERRQRTISYAVTASNQNLWDRMIRIVDAMRVIRVFGQQAREQERFAAAAERVRQEGYAAHRLVALVAPSVDLLLAVLFVVILLAAYMLGISVALVTAFLVLLSRAQPHAKAITQARLGIASVRGSIAEVEWLLSQEVPPERPGGPVASATAAPIRFEGVSYAYPDGSVAVSDITLTLQPGVVTALIGRSGSGKTTLVNLVCRLVEPNSGAIWLGDRRLDTIDPATWRERIGIAGQDIDLLDGTIAENIAYGQPGASREEIERAAALAGADGFVPLLPHGYDTDVGREGLKLSGGQRQRIGLARALLRNPDLLILDEATSAVDALSEREIMKLLTEHRNFHTALVISHRKSTLVACQQGIVIEQGRILEAGALRELEYYRHMAGDGELGG